MLRNGIPEEVTAALRSVSRSFRGWGSQVEVTRPLADGEEIAASATARLEVLHRPGHSPSDTVFWDAERRILIAADHLLAHISSNPLITPPPRRLRAARPRRSSPTSSRCGKTREMPAEIVLSGHGEPIVDHVRADRRAPRHDTSGARRRSTG